MILGHHSENTDWLLIVLTVCTWLSPVLNNQEHGHVLLQSQNPNANKITFISIGSSLYRKSECHLPLFLSLCLLLLSEILRGPSYRILWEFNTRIHMNHTSCCLFVYWTMCCSSLQDFVSYFHQGKLDRSFKWQKIVSCL